MILFKKFQAGTLTKIRFPKAFIYSVVKHLSIKENKFIDKLIRIDVIYEEDNDV